MGWKNVEDRQQYMRSYMRELRATRKRLGICIMCGKENAFSSFKLCARCMEKEAARIARIIRKRKHMTGSEKDKIRAISKKSAKKVYRERKEAGLCPRCGRHQPIDGKVHCEICLLKKREQIANAKPPFVAVIGVKRHLRSDEQPHFGEKDG